MIPRVFAVLHAFDNLKVLLKATMLVGGDDRKRRNRHDAPQYPEPYRQPGVLAALVGHQRSLLLTPAYMEPSTPYFVERDLKRIPGSRGTLQPGNSPGGMSDDAGLVGCPQGVRQALESRSAAT